MALKACHASISLAAGGPEWVSGRNTSLVRPSQLPTAFSSRLVAQTCDFTTLIWLSCSAAMTRRKANAQGVPRVEPGRHRAF